MNRASPPLNIPLAPCRILNVNDAAAVRHAISCILARAGLAVTEAEDAASALRAIEEQPPELVLVDVNLPGMGGYELCAQIRQNPRTAHLPVVFLSALSKDDASRARGLEHGADGYLTWPVNQEVLAATIKSVLRLRQTEARLRESEERFRTTFEQAAIGLGHLTLEGQWTWVNSRLCHILGCSQAELLEKTWRDAACPEDLPALADRRRALLAGEVESFAVEQRCRRPDGSLVWTGWTVSLVRQSGGEPRHFLVVVADISVRKWTDENLLRLRAGIEASSEAVAIADPDGHHAYHNQAFTTMFGYRVEELLELLDPVALYADPAAGLAVFAAIMDGQSWRGEVEMVARDGRRLPVELRADAIRDEHGQIIGLIGIHTDATDRKRAEQERTAMEVQMRQQQKLESIGTLAGGVAHEINNPINGIMNYAQLIQDRLPAGSPLAEYTGEILHETQRVATIVRDLLQFSRAEKQSHSPARLADMVEGTLSLIRTVIRHDQITLNVSVPEDLPELKCRSQQIQQVLMNLMTNARDALNERYPGHDPDKVLILSAGLFEKEGRQWIRVTVEDHGTGITPAVRERMFDPFFTTKPRDRGTGLGLAISHSIVKEHDGELAVETEPGRFTRMHLDLLVDNGRGMENDDSQSASGRGGISPPARQNPGLS